MGSWIAACGVGDVDPEDVIPFAHEGADYAIYRSPDDEYYATDGHCTHEKTLLCDGLVMGRVIECPKHNGRFDYASGKALGRRYWRTFGPIRSRWWTGRSLLRSARRYDPRA
ncbi:MAG TPA: Rieske 2Fe-2S domain-containing protein [Streptosporangiaceae bacterium]|nr:Rieske 2Fe-2S domain-containing protein [Streptosporangiaceae bacterium]